MDAKPIRRWGVYQDENNAQNNAQNTASSLRTLHTRHNSSPHNLNSLYTNGASITGRGLADISNTHNPTRRLAKDDLAVPGKGLGGMKNDKASLMVSQKENEKPGTAFLRPAQRPLKDSTNVAKPFHNKENILDGLHDTEKGAAARKEGSKKASTTIKDQNVQGVDSSGPKSAADFSRSIEPKAFSSEQEAQSFYQAPHRAAIRNALPPLIEDVPEANSVQSADITANKSVDGHPATHTSKTSASNGNAPSLNLVSGVGVVRREVEALVKAQDLTGPVGDARPRIIDSDSDKHEPCIATSNGAAEMAEVARPFLQAEENGLHSLIKPFIHQASITDANLATAQAPEASSTHIELSTAQHAREAAEIQPSFSSEHSWLPTHVHAYPAIAEAIAQHPSVDVSQEAVVEIPALEGDIQADSLVHPGEIEAASLAIVAQNALQSNKTEAELITEDLEYEGDEHYPEDHEEQDFVTALSAPSLGDNLTEHTATVIMPRSSIVAEREKAVARQYVETLLTPADYEDELADVSMVAEYGSEIFAYMREMEAKLQPNPTYMDHQKEIQWPMRSILMDWIVQVHQRFSLLPETLFLTANYVDRFLSAKVVSLNKLQLVGATALFVASKYEEINCPSVSEIEYMVDRGYTVEEILKAERFMLSMLQFELGWPGPMSFLRRISKADDYDLETRTLAKYFLEVTLMDECFLGCPPSFLAAGAHCLSRQLLNKGSWGLDHVYYSDYTYRQLYPLVEQILHCCQEPEVHHRAVFEKYQDRRFKYASRYVKQELHRGFELEEVRPYFAQHQVTPVVHSINPMCMFPDQDGVGLWYDPELFSGALP